MNATLLSIACLLVSAQADEIYEGTPADLLAAIYYNAALTDEAIQDHTVEITGSLSRVERDGLGNYIAIMQSNVRAFDGDRTVIVRFAFPPTAKAELAKQTAPNQEVTIRGACRFINDTLRRVAHNTVTVDVLNCKLVSGN